MAEIGFKDDVLRVGFKVAEKSGRQHPWDADIVVFWFELCHPTLKPLKADEDFIQKLRGIYACLNLLNKPMQIYNLDECGISTVHKPGHIITELKHKSA